MATREEIAALPDSITIPLKKPIEIGELRWTEFTFREPNANQLVDAGTLEGLASMQRLLAVTAGVPPAAIGKMTLREWRQAASYMAALSEEPREEEDAPNPWADRFSIALQRRRV